MGTGVRSPFSRANVDGVALWVGTPDCQSAHDALLIWLRENGVTFKTSRAQVLQSIRGNLGESVVFCVGIWNDFRLHTPFAGNALAPLQNISKPGIDILWLVIGTDATGDIAFLQEVKTTAGLDLAYADTVIADYEKLFGTDANLTLHTRLQEIKTVLQYQHKVSRNILLRVSGLAGNSPASSPKIRLVPTLVHDRNSSPPATKMVAIRETLVGQGWIADAVMPWAIGLTQLDDRLHRLAMGQR